VTFLVTIVKPTLKDFLFVVTTTNIFSIQFALKRNLNWSSLDDWSRLGTSGKRLDIYSLISNAIAYF
jgi:hypothetical protein